MTPELPVHLRHLEGCDNRGRQLVVVIPVCRPDWHLAVKLLKWIVVLRRDHQHMPPIVAYCAPGLKNDECAALLAIDPMFTVIQATHFKDKGYFGSANEMIKGALDLCEKDYPDKAMLWVEADCVPMSWDWVDQIAAEYRGCGQPFMGDLVLCELNHLTGNAVYSPNWRTVAPSLAALPGPDTEWGWDSQAADDTLTRAHRAKTIQQIWRPPLPITAAWAAQNIRPETALFHQVKDGSLIDVLCARDGVPLIPLPKQLEESSYAKGRTKNVITPAARRLTPGARMIAGLPMVLPGGPPPPAPAPAPFTSILYVTYAKDIEFLKYSLKSVEKYATGFASVVVVVPRHEMSLFSWVKKAEVIPFDEPTGRGMLAHMAMKCRADELCPNAQAILHMDADCLFWQPASPGDFFQDGKPILVRERYVDIKNPNRVNWQKCVQSAIGFKPEYETMVRFPQVHLRDVYPKTRELVSSHTMKSFDEHVLSGPNSFPQEYCEFCTLGAVAIAHFRNQYHCVDYDRNRDSHECGVPIGAWQHIYRRDRDKVVEVWGHGGIASYKSDIEAWLSGRTPSYFIK